jgi:hypothetical protein
MGHLGIDTQELMISQQMHSENPQFQQAMMQMNMKGDGEEESNNMMSKEKAKEMFLYMQSEATGMVKSM